MIYNVRINDKLYEVEVEEGKATLLRSETVKAAAPAASVPPAAADIPAPAPAATPVPAPAGGAGVQTAPLPGVVLEVKVAKGQAVKEGQLLLILEAMKMENEIFSKTSGTVAQIYAAKGAQVNTGDPLVSVV